jgi:diacylglycerol kinase family enzyme
VPGLFLGIVSNAAPWTYLGERPVNPSPQASFDAGLDLFALRSLRTTTTLRHARQLLAASGKGPRGRAVLSVHDAEEFTLRADVPQALQVDGDAIGRRATVRFRAVPRALRVLV